MCLVDHPCRQIQTGDGHAPRGEVGGHVAWPGTELYDVALVRDQRRETIEELAVERLAVELAGDLVGVPPRDGVIRRARVFLTERGVSLRRRPVRSAVCSPRASSARI